MITSFKITSKEALERLQENAYCAKELPASNWTDYYGSEGKVIHDEVELEMAIDKDVEKIQEDLERLEKLEKAMEIIVRCDVVIHAVKQYSYKGYIGLCNYCCHGKPYPTEDEFELLKEIFKKEEI